MTSFKLILITFTLLILGSCGIHNKSFSENKNWLEGKWTGKAFQIDLTEDNQWTIELDVNIKKEIYNISYPSLNCSGKWKLIKYSKDQATFKEVIENNTTVCIKHGIIILSKIDNRRVLYSYFYNDGINNDGTKAAAFSTLEKNK